MNAIAKNFREAWKQALRFVSREHLLALVDQGVVSGTSFLTTLSIARWSGSSQLGIYAVGMTLLFTLLAFQDSLISQPYAIQRHYPEGSAAERAGASLTLSILFSTASILVLTVTALGFLTWGLSHELVTVTWAIAGIVPFALTRDFARRFAFARLDGSRSYSGFGRCNSSALRAGLAGSEWSNVCRQRVGRYRRRKRIGSGRLAVLHARRAYDSPATGSSSN